MKFEFEKFTKKSIFVVLKKKARKLLFMRALCFPGQGTQFIGMGKILSGEFSIARHTFQEADEALGDSLCSRAMQEGDEHALHLTRNAQPAILAHSTAMLRVLQTQFGFEIDSVSILMGHSLGEFTAMVTAGVLSFSDALRLVRQRGECMQQASNRYFTDRDEVPSMMALIPADFQTCQDSIVHAGLIDEVCQVANVNGPKQVVLSGGSKAVDKVSVIAKSLYKVRRAIPLKVSAPFHSQIMRGAEADFQVCINNCKWSKPAIPIISNIDGSIMHLENTIRSNALQQMSSAVRWDHCVAKAHEIGTKEYIEIGAAVLSPMIKSILKDADCTSYKESDTLFTKKT